MKVHMQKSYILSENNEVSFSKDEKKPEIYYQNKLNLHNLYKFANKNFHYYCHEAAVLI
jgi:hypothetical protein